MNIIPKRRIDSRPNHPSHSTPKTAPKKTSIMTGIRDPDLSALRLDTVRHGSLTLKTTLALTLEPTLNETKQLLCTQDSGLGIDAFAPTREALLAELHEQLAMLWQEYAQAPDIDLDGPALRLKATLLARFNAPTLVGACLSGLLFTT